MIKIVGSQLIFNQSKFKIMKRLKFVFLTVFILCLSSCAKENSYSSSSNVELSSIVEIQESLLQIDPTEVNSFFSFNLVEGFNQHLDDRISTRSEEEFLEEAFVNLFNQNQYLNFVPYMVNQVGLPVWTSAFVDEDNHSISIPFVDETNNFTKAHLVGKKNEENNVFHFEFFERRYLDLGLPLEETDKQKIILMITHDIDLFDEFDRSLYDLYKENKLKGDDNTTSTRTTRDVVLICRCYYNWELFAFKDDKESSESRNCLGGSEYHCIATEISIPCTGGDGSQVGGNGTFDPTNSNYNPSNPNGSCVGCSPGTGSSSSGNGGTFIPPFLDDILMLQNCVFGDVADLDIDGSVTGINNNTDLEFCESWNYYKEKCLSEEFDGVQLLTLPLNSTPNYMSNPYYIWGQFASANPDLLEDIMNTDFGCVTSDQLDLAVDVDEAFDLFVADYGLELTYSQVKAIKKAAMDNGVWDEEDALEYLGLSGQDWIFDEEFWNNPNLTFQTQNLPSYQDFYNAFPKTSTGSWLYGADNIYGLVGGDVLQARNDYPSLTSNTCALKVSIALNGAGINIPDIASTSTQPGTLLGADGNYYFLNARALKNWMILTFGETNSDYHTSFVSELEENETLDDYLDSKKGVLILDYGGSGTSGHADIYTGSDCSSSGCAYSGFGSIHFWELD